MPSISSLLIFLVPLTESQIHIDYLAVSSTVSPSLLPWGWNYTYGPQQPASTWMLEIQTQILPCVCAKHYSLSLSSPKIHFKCIQSRNVGVLTNINTL